MGLTDGQSSVYDQIGFKTDDREIYTPPAAHLVASIEGLTEGPPLPPEPEVHKAQASDQQASSSSSAAELGSIEGLEPKPDPAHPADYSDLELGASDPMSTQDAAEKTPDSCPAGIKFCIPPTPHIEYCPDYSGRSDIWDLMYVKQ
jgi:hypothetical protein